VASLAEIRERDMFRCARCGSAGPLHIHHRRRRSQGGGESWGNLVTLCAACHDWVHAHPSAARGDGWLLARGTVAEQVPVPHYGWPASEVLLCGDGTVQLWVS
jgi:hypothetical protein